MCPPLEGATPPFHVAARTSERRHGPVREQAPHLEGSEEGQGWGRRHEKYFTATFRTRLSPRVPGHPFFSEPRGPQDQDQLRTMEQAAAYAPMVQILDIPVPQLVDQLADVMRFFDTLLPVPEQAIEVPKILLDDVPVRTSVRDTQLAEQLVEVPTIISYSSLQRPVEQHVDIPVPGGGVRNVLAFKVFFLWTKFNSDFFFVCKTRISERIVEQIAVDPVSSGGLQGSLPGQGSSSSSHVPAGVEEPARMSLVKGFFTHFSPKLKKVRSWVRTRVRRYPPVSAHPRWRLSSRMRPCRTPTSGCSSLMAARPITGTDAPNATVWQSPPGVNEVWVGKMDEDGVPYCWHRDTRVSRYGLPPLPPG